MPFGYAAAIAAAGSLATGLLGSNASKDAAKQQAGAAHDALSMTTGVYNDTKAAIQPYATAGGNALADLQKMLGIGSPGGPSSPVLQALGIGGPGPQGAIDPSKFVGSPGYNYQLEQGQNAITNSAAARGGGLGGNALLALQRNGQGLANQNWNQYLGNVDTGWQHLLGGVSGLANGGLNAAESLGRFGSGYAGAASGDILGAGNSQAAGTIGSTNALTGGINDALKALLSGGMAARGGTGGGGSGLETLLNSLAGGSRSYGSLDPTGYSIAPTPEGGWQ